MSETEIIVQAKGRTGSQRAKLKLRAIYDAESQTISIRVDDEANLEFWLESTLPYPRPVLNKD